MECGSGLGMTMWEGAGMTVKKDGTVGREGVEGPGRLRRKSATPVPMRGVRPRGRATTATNLRQPHTSERMWTRREKISLWGSPVHQKCSTITEGMGAGTRDRRS